MARLNGLLMFINSYIFINFVFYFVFYFFIFIWKDQVFHGLLSIIYLLQCEPTSQFTCSTDAACVDIKCRCDNKIDCEDESDEEDCQLLVPGSNYKKSRPPPPIGKGIDIVLDIGMSQVDNFQELDSLYGIQFSLVARWKDARLAFSNLRQKYTDNRLGETEQSLIWTPTIQFEFGVGDHGFGVKYGATIIVEKGSEGTAMSIENIHEGKTYLGSENNLTMIQLFKLQHSCVFELKNYPFDQQTCELKVRTYAFT